ncbi:MAG TPA: FAD-binding oxidoreductase [Candidatus Acidoferrum sp.]|nr:FAD-binding oxidoreductase [Candidatus Acidoferrum sp.]
MDASVSSKATINTFEADVREIVTAKYVRTAAESDAVAGAKPTIVIEPGSEQELAKALKGANAAGLAVIPRGGGTKLEWGNQPARADVILSTARLNRVIEHAWADLTVSVEAGCTIGKLQETLAKHGQRLALDALWPERATVGGVLSTNDSGALRLRFGSLRDLVIGATLALADGTVASSGGKVVKNVAGYDLPKLVTGAFGTLGIITRAIFRLHPLPKETLTISCVASNVLEAQRLVLAIQNSKLAHSALQICCEAEMQPRVDVLFEGTEAGLTAQVEQVKSMMGLATITDAGRDVWNARQEIYSTGKKGSAEFSVVKFATLPAQIAETIETIASLSIADVRWKVVVQATGIGWARLEGEVSAMDSVLREFRSALERNGGSSMVAHRPAGMTALDAWGSAGDALPLMSAVKWQFDPDRTLNPGRFVGGI